jgi:hypothetical protein
MPHQSLSVQKLPIRPFLTLHKGYHPSSAAICPPGTPLFSGLLEAVYGTNPCIEPGVARHYAPLASLIQDRTLLAAPQGGHL